MSLPREPGRYIGDILFPPRVEFTDHFIKRFRRRVRGVSPRYMAAWLSGALAARLPVRLGNEYHLEVGGRQYVAVLGLRDDGVWVAITIYRLTPAAPLVRRTAALQHRGG